MRMRFLAPLFLALSLTTGCQQIAGAINTAVTIANLDVQNPVSEARVYQLRAAYDAGFLVPAVAYRRLPLCGPGETTLRNACAQRNVVLRLQAADRAAEVALDRLEVFVRANPRLNAVALFSAAEQAVAVAREAFAAVR